MKTVTPERREAQREYQRRYEATPERREAKRVYNATHREAHREAQRKYNATHREAQRETKRVYEATPKGRAARRKYRAQGGAHRAYLREQREALAAIQAALR